MIKKKSSWLWVACLAVGMGSVQAAELETFEQRLGYALGADMAKGLKEKGLEVDPEALVLGFRDQMSGKPLRLNEQQLNALAAETQKKVAAYEAALQEQAAHENAEKEKRFFAQNAKKQGIKTLPEGIQYEVLASGKGPQPALTDTVDVHYKGMLLDGKVFDSSYDRGKPLRIQLDQVIKGWQVVLPKMHVGDKWRVWIPAKLAYGERGAGGVIGPNEPLVFEIELLNVLPPQEQGSGA